MFPNAGLSWFSIHRCRSPRLSRAWVILLAAGATLTLWAVSNWIAGIDLRVEESGSSVSAVNVLASTLLAGGIAWAVATLLERFVKRARTAWTLGCLFSLGGSLIGPLSGGVTASATVVLVAMHIVAAAILILGFRHTLHDR